MSNANTRIVAFGPEMPGWGSWQWVGENIRQELAHQFSTLSFGGDAVPAADVVIFVKFAPSLELIESVSRRARVIYLPVDYYGSAVDIDADAAMLRKCSRILVHCERLRKYFEPYATVETIDHRVKFVAPMRAEFKSDDYILSVGVRTNLPPLIEWVNEHPLPSELRALTNPERPGFVPSPAEFGFRPGISVTIEGWSMDRQIELTAGDRAAIDTKGNDFRSRQIVAKAIDFIASGAPLAMNPDSSPVEHRARWDSKSHRHRKPSAGERRAYRGDLAEPSRRLTCAFAEQDRSGGGKKHIL